ncbi:hypothetical protein BP5796_10498 [Coleophoma crateriformis]|uniref:Alcohol acetyltransferase n=1 Tax=Coleophoma crateriformis TaxID=565419 RepID=A0A3D8QQ98_9HELO|nr:hypothetical protein BP5796_10498 [Coleophoma crateriformis]
MANTSILKFALAKNILRHPNLCHGITDLDPESGEAHFTRLEAINWSSVVEEHACVRGQSPDEELASLMGKAHQTLFTDQERSPAWKILLLRHEDLKVVDLILVAHHAICDGMSATAFHQSLLGFLLEGAASAKPETNWIVHSEWPVKVPQTVTAPVPVERFIKLSKEQSSIPETSSPPSTFTPWAANPPTLSTFVSRAHFLTVPRHRLDSLIEFCTRLGVSLTGYIHSLLVSYLSVNIPSAQGFKSGTPYSLRRFTGCAAAEMVNHMSSIDSNWDEELVQEIRRSSKTVAEEEQIIQKISQQFRADLKRETARVLLDGPTMLRDISQIKNLGQFCEESMKKRSYTYELSNLGDIELPTPEQEPSKLRAEKLLFTQCGMVTGPAFGCNVVGVKGGDLVIGITWQEGIIEEDLIFGMARFLEGKITQVSR